MRHQQIGRKLGVDHSHRKALLRSLSLALIERETIRTTPARAKELRWFADRIITLAKRGDLSSRRQLIKLLGSTETQHTGENRIRNAIERVHTLLAPRFKDRNGGYTQIIRLAKRRAGDNAELCVMRYIPPVDDKKSKESDKGKKSQKTANKKTDVEAKAASGGKGSVKTKGKAEKEHDHHHDHAPQDKTAKSKNPKKDKDKEQGE
jgi:large subunit ribosomal protein L17